MSENGTTKANHWAQSERAVLSDLLDQLGPDVPTLCEGWTARDLAGHLIVREGRPDAAMGIMVPALAGYEKKVRLKAQNKDWDAVINKIRTGPPRSSMMRATKVDGLANTIEFFVHVEDLRRAQPAWQERDLAPEFQAELWDKIKGFAPRLMKSSPVAIVLATPDGKRFQACQGPQTVTITGQPAELTLFAYGRSAVHVEFSGPDDAITAVQSCSFGI
ncbi:MAG: TIGR03085 family protein [Actinobacteria bacterium]|uniref:Unannotated protein n=1 Tax=freshwater metagenome TaxID=449393 RepID=A0A6J6W4F8_9ZZZZ|nr:TIGR03085 family protein [Actinomycetota bacterium]